MKRVKILPSEDVMYRALVEKDSEFEGIFFAAIKTTGIFCRPTCTARKPKAINVEYFSTSYEAMLQGYRPCKICTPLSASGEAPSWIKPLMKKIHTNPNIKIKDWQLREDNIDPNRVRRWFKKHHGMTFHTYLRVLRITDAYGKIKNGAGVAATAFDSGYESLSGFTDSFKKSLGISPIKSKDRNVISTKKIVTPLGPMLVGASEHGICLFEFIDRPMLETELKQLQHYFKADLLPGNSPHISQLETEIMDYFSGKRKQFDVPLDLRGTEFQVKVWNILLDIPYGSVRSYKQQAEAIGNPKAVRAVARANGDNRIAILIPCHRVIGSDGKLVGYGGGIWRKQHLLQLEGAILV